MFNFTARLRSVVCLYAVPAALMVFPGFAPAGQAQQTARGTCPTSGVSGAVPMRSSSTGTTHASRLCAGHALTSSVSASGAPLSLASTDFDEDGVPDLVSGYGSDSGGTLIVHRGNIAALWPYGAAVAAETPAAFLPGARLVTVPEAPDLVVVGDFDADGHQDIVTARLGSNAFYFLKGNGHGGFAAAKRIGVAGSITDLIAGEMNQADGLPDLAVGVTNAIGSAAEVYESPLGAVKADPEAFPLSHPATALSLGHLISAGLSDLVIGGGSQVTVVHGRARRLSNGGSAEAAKVSTQAVAFGVRALVAGDFTGSAPSVAVLGDDGAVHILEHAVSFVPPASASIAIAGGDKDGHPIVLGPTPSPALQARVTAMSRAVQTDATQEWTERAVLALPRGYSAASPRLIRARMSGTGLDDLLTMDSTHNQVHVMAARNGLSALHAMAVGGRAVASPAMDLVWSLDTTSAPAAVLPMRLSQHGLSGLVTLQAAERSPVVAPADIPPAATFTVTNTLDITDASQKNSPPAGSLRAAMEGAQTAGAAAGGGTYSIVFNIPTSDPGYNATTGTWTIKPHSENVPNSLDYFALPPINYAVTIDGYTQPGSSPNTLANGDNAKIAIIIDGSQATTTGGSGFVPFDDSGSVFRGMALVNWTNPTINSGNTASGAWGIETNGVGDFVEGNFIGTTDGHTAAGNRVGIFADNGPLSQSGGGNIIGGTTPQARNLISGNQQGGILVLSTGLETQVQGNYIGTDVTGAATLPNTSDGVGMNGPGVTIGGTLAGDGNLISGNGTNVDINDLTNGNAATGSFVQGNLIGTDYTGTKSLSQYATGVSILHNPTNYIIGGTTPSARNIISGNNYGVSIFDNVFYNSVQGNYIGTDPTGTIAVGNKAQGVIMGLSVSTGVPAGFTTVGGSVPAAGNLISANGSDGVSISGSALYGGYTYPTNTVQGNFIGTDVTGTKALPNAGNGITATAGATNTMIGGSNSGLGNLIAYNAKNGVNIDPGTSGGPGVSNTTIANIIASNGGAGVRVVSGTGNRISANSIYGNGALGIDIDAAGPGTNTHCNATDRRRQRAAELSGADGGRGPDVHQCDRDGTPAGIPPSFQRRSPQPK